MSRSIKKLAIVGASARAAAFSALNAGFEVVAADLFADADLQAVCSATRVSDYPKGLADWLASTECDAWMYTGALENYPELVDRMAATRPLLGNGGEALRQIRDPLLLQSALHDEGLLFPETVDSAAGLPLDGSWLCKTYRGSSGSGVWRLDGAPAFDRAERHRAVLQRDVAGTPAAAIFVVGTVTCCLLGVSRQLLGAAPTGSRSFQYVGSVGPLAVSAAVRQQLERVGDLLARRFNLRGLVGVDLVIAGDNAWVIEVNPRFTASAEVVERWCGMTPIAAHVAACNTANWASNASPESTSAPSYGKTIHFAERDVTISASFSRWAMSQSSIEPHKRRLADIPAAGESIAAGHPVLTAFASSPSGPCEEALQSQLAAVRERLYTDPLTSES